MKTTGCQMEMAGWLIKKAVPPMKTAACAAEKADAEAKTTDPSAPDRLYI